MTSGGRGLLSASSRVLRRISARSNSLHVGPGVKLKRCESQPLERVRITVLHNGAKAKVIANLLSSRGAEVTHFIKEGSKLPDVEGQGVFVNLDNPKSSRSELLASLKSADVFVDSSTRGIGMAPNDVIKMCPRLIYTAVKEASSPFSSMRALAYISSGLYHRENTTLGQVIELSDSTEALRRLEANQLDAAEQAK
ncbi:hypothetical protein PMAYCL1PPCAC_00709 [Pristionchus mayeri]|uniref:Uncharacterized protein n=1 Tax=Pristionchus mayeri TaxID=1317129 RepID=A0AAN5C6A0_9BILA|nr:hypothetical protein PMAYCL1PPCAC_00709 [Pristionchus mayeri]